MLDHDVTPLVDVGSQAFWKGLERNDFVVGQCADCDAYLFPAREICATCYSRKVRDAVVTGPGRIYSFTVNYQNWGPGYEQPYGVLVVDYENYGLRLLGLANVDDLDEITIGVEVRLDCVTLSGGQVVPAFSPSPTVHDAGRSRISE